MTLFRPEERALFEGPNYVTVATLGKDGSPRSTAIWVDIDGDDILLNGATSRKWVANLRRDPRVSLNIFDQTNPYNQVNVLGKVENVTAEGAEAHIDKLSHKYNGKDYPYHKADDPRQLVRVHVTKVWTSTRSHEER